MWEGGFKDQFLAEIAKIKIGSPTEWDNFMGPVMYVLCLYPFLHNAYSNCYSGRPGYDKIMSYIDKAKKEGGEVLIGGTGDDSKGYFVKPTVILTKDPKSITMREEIFGPVITVYVYEDQDWEKTFELVDTTTSYGLTGAMYVFQFCCREGIN